MLAIRNCKAILPKSIIDNAIVIIDQGRIIDLGPADVTPKPDGCDAVDAGGDYLGPGFIDLHCHGGGGAWWFEDPAGFANTHLRHGTTSLLSTTGMHRDLDELCEGIDRTAEAMGDGTAANIIGIHMEGPYKNPKYGAQPAQSIEIRKRDYDKILAHGKEVIKIWTIAPEVEGMADFVADIKPHGAVLSVGHSEATAEQINRFVPDGLRLACHCMCATGVSPSLSGSVGTREVGVDEAVLLEDRIFAEVIPDARGLHVRQGMLQLIVKTKGVDRVIVVTDGTADSGVKGLSPGEADVNYNEIGLCGSLLTMDAAARNMRNHAGLSMPEIFTMAALNPARVLGIDDEFGSLALGKVANFVQVDEQLSLHRVFLRGEKVAI